jgi:3-oxoacyl-[acyl-carrier protein] reductase
VEDAVRRSGCALITGASRGIGAAVARVLAAEGWPVGVNYRVDREGAAAVVAEIGRAGGEAVAVAADVVRREEVERAFASLEDRHGPVLVLVNNAGTRHDGPFTGMERSAWDEVLEVNLDAAFMTMRRAIAGMVRERFGRIVNVSSVGGARSLAGQANYAASKAGLEALTRTVAVEVARRGVTVNAVAPGFVVTELSADVGSNVHAAVPARRPATLAEIAACVRFLTSDAAAYVTGTTLVADGGLSAALLPMHRI